MKNGLLAAIKGNKKAMITSLIGGIAIGGLMILKEALKADDEDNYSDEIDAEEAIDADFTEE